MSTRALGSQPTAVLIVVIIIIIILVVVIIIIVIQIIIVIIIIVIIIIMIIGVECPRPTHSTEILGRGDDTVGNPHRAQIS